MEVELLDHTYLNDKSEKPLGITREVDPFKLLPFRLTGTGIAMANSLRKALTDEVDCYAVKTSLELDDYEQIDDKGVSYLDADKYGQHLPVNISQNTFEPNSDHKKYLETSGYAKIIRVDDSNKVVYNGVEHTQILTERLGYIPIRGDQDYIVDMSNKVRIPLDQLWFFIGECDKDEFTNLDEIQAIENKGHIILEINVRDHLCVVYCTRQDGNLVWRNITKKCKGNAAYVKGVEPDALLPCNTLITYLKSGQQIKGHMRVARGTGRQYAKWQPVICRYKFDTELARASSAAATAAAVADDEAAASAEDTGEGVNVQQRKYRVSQNNGLLQSVFANEPESIILTLQSVYRLDVPTAMFRAIGAIQHWMYRFRNQLFDIFLKGLETPPITIEKYQYPLLILQLRDCNHSFIGLLTDYVIRYLVDCVDHRRWQVGSNWTKMQQELAAIAAETVSSGQSGGRQRGGKGSVLRRRLSEYHQEWQTHASESEKLLTTRGIGPREFIHGHTEQLLDTLSFEEFHLRQQAEDTSLGDKRGLLKQWLESTMVAYRKRHPLRLEAYLTVKFPEALLDAVSDDELLDFFFKSITEPDTLDPNHAKLYRIIYLLQGSLNYLDDHLDRLRFKTIEAIRNKLEPRDYGDKRDSPYGRLVTNLENWEYHKMISQTDFITKYDLSTKIGMDYYEHQNHEGAASRGQRKLMLTEVFFLSKFVTPETEGPVVPRYLVVYAGAADGSHQLLLSKMFPDVTFALFDPNFSRVKEQYDTGPNTVRNIFSMHNLTYYDKRAYGDSEKPELVSHEIDLSNSQYHIFPCFFNEEVAKTMVQLAGTRKILFISDLRVMPDEKQFPNKFSDEYKRESQRLVYIDNYNQYSMITTLAKTSKNFTASMIKFRFPYKEYKEEYLKMMQRFRLDERHNGEQYFEYNQFLKGDIYIQPYARGSTTEARHITTRDAVLKRDAVMTYDDVKYERFFSYINNMVRRHMRFPCPRITSNFHPKFRLYHKYDHMLELLILNQYVTRFFREEIEEGTLNPLDKIREYLYDIERDPVMGKIDWREKIRS